MCQELLSLGVTAMIKQMKSHLFNGRCDKIKPEQNKRRKPSSLPPKWVQETMPDNMNHTGTQRHQKNSVMGSGQGYCGVDESLRGAILVEKGAGTCRDF